MPRNRWTTKGIDAQVEILLTMLNRPEVEYLPSADIHEALHRLSRAVSLTGCELLRFPRILSQRQTSTTCTPTARKTSTSSDIAAPHKSKTRAQGQPGTSRHHQ